MPCNAKTTPTIQTVLKTPPNVAREYQSVSSHLGANFWQDIESDGLMMLHSISPLRGCNTPNSNTGPQNASPKKRWKRRRLVRTTEPVPPGDGNADEKDVSKDIIAADNSPCVKRSKSKTRRRRCRRKSSLMRKGTPVFVSTQEDAAAIVENIDGESLASVKPIHNSKQADPEQVFEKSSLDCEDPLKAPVDPLGTGQKRVVAEVAATKVKRLKKNDGKKKGLESAGHLQNYHSGKTKRGNMSENTPELLDSSTPVAVISAEYLVEPQGTSTDLGRFETPTSTRFQQITSHKAKKQKCKRNTPASGKSLEEPKTMVQSTDGNDQRVEGVGVLHKQQTPPMSSPANLSLNVSITDLLKELSTSKRSRLSTRLAKAKIACHEEKRRRRISLKRKHRSSGELDVTPGEMKQLKDDLQPRDDLHTVKSQDIRLSASLMSPSDIPGILDETQSKVLHEHLDTNKSPIKNGSDFETPTQQRAGAGLTCCTLCSCSCKCPPSIKKTSTASEGIQTSETVSQGVQISPVVFKPDTPESEHTKTSTHSPYNSQPCQTDFHETQTQTVHEPTSFANQIRPQDWSTSIPPSDQKEESRKVTETKLKNFFDSLLHLSTRKNPFHETQMQTAHETTSFANQSHPQNCSILIPPSDQKEEPTKATDTEVKSFFDSLLVSARSKNFSKPTSPPRKGTELSESLKSVFGTVLHLPTCSNASSKPTPLLRRQSHRRRIKSAASSDSTRQTDSLCSQSSSEEAATLKSHCLSPVIQLLKPPPAPGETSPKGLPLNFMKFSMHSGRRSVGKKQTRIPQELFTSSGESDSDVGRARAAAQRFINMTEGCASDDGLGDRRVDDDEKVVASQQVRRRKYRGFLGDSDSDSGSDGVDDVDITDGEERSSQGVIDDGGGGASSNEEYIDSDETVEQQIYTSDEEDDDQTIVGTSASDDDGGEGDVGSNDVQEDWSEEPDDDEDYGNIFILDQAAESRLTDDSESDSYSDANDSDRTVESQSDNLSEGDTIKDRQQTQTTDNKLYGRRLSPRKNRRRILVGLFSSSEDSNSDDGTVTAVAQREINNSEGGHSCDDKCGHLEVSIGEKVVARHLSHRRKNRVVLDDSSSSGNSTDIDTDQNSSVEDIQENVLQKQTSSASFADEDGNKSKSIEQVKLKERLKPTGLLTVKGKMLKIFKQQAAERKVITNTFSTKEKRTKSKDIKERDVETSHRKTATEDNQQQPTCSGRAAKLRDEDKQGHRDGNDHDSEVLNQAAGDKSQSEEKVHSHDDDLGDDEHVDEHVDGHVSDNRNEGDVFKGVNEDIDGSDSSDTSLNFTDYGSSEDDPEIYDGLLKKKSKRKKQSEMTGLLDVRRKKLRKHKQMSDGKRTKSRSIKIDCGKTNHQGGKYEELRKEAKSNKRGLSGQAAKSEESDANSDENNLDWEDDLGEDDLGEDGDIDRNSDRAEGVDIKDNDEDIGGSDSDDTIINFTDNNKSGVPVKTCIITQFTRALQSKEVTKAGLLTGRKSAKRTKSRTTLDVTESTENKPVNQDGLLKKMRQKKSQKITGLLTEKGKMENRWATNGKQTKFRSTKEVGGKTDHRQRTSEEQQGEPRCDERDLNGCDIEVTGQDFDDGENEDNGNRGLNFSDDVSHGVRSQTSPLRQSKRATQLKTKENTKEGLLKESESPQRKRVKTSVDQTDRKEDDPSKRGGLLDRGKSLQKLTQKTLPEMVEMGKSKKTPALTKRMEEYLHLDNYNERSDNSKPTQSWRQAKSPGKTRLIVFADKGEIPKLLKEQAEREKTKDELATDGKQTKSRDSQQEDGRDNHQERISEENQQVTRNKKKDLNHWESTSMGTDNASNSNNESDAEVVSCGISEGSHDKEEVQDDDLDGDGTEDNEDGCLICSDDVSHGVRSQTSSRQSKKMSQLKTKKNTNDGVLKERKSPGRKTIKKSLDFTERKEDDPEAGLLDKSKPLQKLRPKTQPKKSEKQTESKKTKTKLVTNGLKTLSRKSKQVDVKTSRVEKTSEGNYGDSAIDNTNEDAGSIEHEGIGNTGIISKTCNLKRPTKSKTAKPEKALKRELMKERNSPTNSDLRKFIKTFEPKEVIAGLMSNSKSAKKKKQTSTGRNSVDEDHGQPCREISRSTQSTKFTKLRSKEDTKEGQLKEKKTPKATRSTKIIAWTKLINDNGTSGKSNSVNFEESDGNNSDCYMEVVDMVLSGKPQDKREDDSCDDGSSDDESLDGNLLDDEDKDREENATSDGVPYVREADDDMRNGSHCEDFSHDGKNISKHWMKKKLQIGGDAVRRSTDKNCGDVQEDRAEGDARKEGDEGVDGFDSDDSSLPLTGEVSSGVSCNTRNREAGKGSGMSSTTVQGVQEDEHSFGNEEVSDDQITQSGFRDEGENSASQQNACPFDHMGKSYRGKKHGCTCMIGSSPRAGETRRKTAKNPVLTGRKELDPHSDSIKSKPMKTRSRKPPTINGVLKDKGKMLKVFKQEAARKMIENKLATDVKPEDCRTSCNFREMDYKLYNPIMYTIKSDTNRAICESLITPMPQEWEEPTISDKDREDHRGALRSIFFELLLKRGRKNRLATRRLGKVKINRSPTIKELRKANTAEKRRLKKLEAEVKSDGWIDYDMLPAVYQEIDATDFIKEIK